MAEQVAEPPVTTSSFVNTPSFLDSPETLKAFEDALRADGNLSPTVEPITVPTPTDKAIAPAPDKPPTEKPPETKPPETKPAETKPEADDPEMPTEIRSAEGKKNWKAWKKSTGEKIGQLEKQRDAFENELKELRKAATTPQQKANLADDPEYQTLKKNFEAREKEVNELSERLRLVDVQQHPKFKAYFDGKIEAQMNHAKAIGGDKLVAALQLPDGEYRKQQLNDIAAELDPVSLSQLGGVMTRLREIHDERNSEIAKAKDSWQQMQNEQKASGEKQIADLMALFHRVTAEVTDKEKGLSVFHKRDGDDEWNKRVDTSLALAQSAVSGKLKPEDGMRMIYWGVAAPALLQQNKGLVEKIAELEKTVTELRSAAPAPGGENKGDIPVQEKYVPGLDGMMAEIEKAMRGQ